jgi:hypothetical protein
MQDSSVEQAEDDHQSSSSSKSRQEEENKIPEPLMDREDSKSNMIVLMKAQTWDRESHGLYDYESRRVQKLEKKVENEGYMVRGKDNVSFVETDVPEISKFNSQLTLEEGLQNHNPEDLTALFNLVRKDGKFFVCPINDNEPNDRLWLVIRPLKDGYVIKRHDILKLGRMKFKVKEFRTELEYFEGEHVEKSPHKGFEELHEVQVPDSEDVMCRFCWVGEQTEENPIIGS